jgi:hypothetical protein
MEPYGKAMLTLPTETPTGRFNRALTAFRTRQAAMGNDELQRYKELCGLIGEGRHMEEFAASGVYDFEDYYNALLDAENITNMWKSIKRSISIGIKKPFLRRRWCFYKKMYACPPEDLDLTQVNIARAIFERGDSIGNLDLTTIELGEAFFARYHRTIEEAVTARDPRIYLFGFRYHLARKHQERSKAKENIKRAEEEERRWWDATSGYEEEGPLNEP